MNTTIRLFVGSMAGLAMINVFMFNLFTVITAVALAAVAFLYFKTSKSTYVGACAFLLAEISPGSLHASLSVALVYQGLCILLLVSVLSLRKNGNFLFVYKNALLQIAALTLVPFVVFSILFLTNGLAVSPNQIMAFGVAVLLAVLFIILAAAHYGEHMVGEAGQ